MFFFKIDISSFDDKVSTLFLIPNPQDADENGVPVFSEKALTSAPEYKQFIKDTKTSIVDVAYTLYKTDAVLQNIDKDKFAELQAQNAAEVVDGNEFTITGKKQKSAGSSNKNNFQLYLVFAIIGIVLVIIIVSAALGNKKPGEGTGDSDSSDSSYTSDVSETTEISGTSDTSDSQTSEPDNHDTQEAGVSSAGDSTVNGETSDTDIPQETTDSGYTDGDGYSSSGGTGGGYDDTSEYTIYFHSNGGTGTLDSITSQAGQYVVLPSAETAGKSLKRDGYKLIGFSDNVEINYPLYDYKMPSENITLYAVWEPQEYTVTYNSNGGTGQLSAAKVKYGDDVPMPTEIAVRKSKLNLAGWNTDKSATTALKTLKMPSENITLYAVWSDKKPTAKVTFHYDDSVMVSEIEKGTLDMRQTFGIEKDGYMLSGWYLADSPEPLDYLELTEDCDVYARWERATYITISIDRSYLNQKPLTYKLPLDMNGEAALKLPKVDDKNDIYNSVFGCTYGYSTKNSGGEFGKIEYYGDKEYKFKKSLTLYRVLNKFGGGSGTERDPYIIDYYDQLLYLADTKASGYFKQTADIKFPAEAERKPIDTVTVTSGEDRYYNVLVYDGQNFTIKNIRGEGGLFGTIAASTIKNVSIDGASISVKSNGGVICNSVTSYSFGNKKTTGNSKIINCRVTNSTIIADNAENVGVICGNGGIIENCLSEKNSIRGSAATKGGIVGSACIVSGCLSNGNVLENGTAVGGIAGAVPGAEVQGSGKIGGDITGCGVTSFVGSGDYCGGIAGQTSSIASGYIRSCYVGNIYLNGKQNGSISGGDGDKVRPHLISYCIADNTNGYPAIGGEYSRSRAVRMVLSVPEDGLKVEGVLSVLNASGSGFSGWKYDKDVNKGYPYPGGITF